MGWLNGVFAFDGACGLDILGDAVDGLDGCKNKYNNTLRTLYSTVQKARAD